MGLGGDIANVAKNMEELSRKANESKDSYSQFVNTLDSGVAVLNNVFQKFTGVGNILGTIPGLTGPAAAAVKTLNDAFSFSTGVVGDLLKGYRGLVVGLDGLSSGQRQLTAELFQSQVVFGTSADSVDDFRKSYSRMQQQFATTDYGFLSPEELRSSIKGLAGVGIGFEEASQNVSGFGRQMNLISAATLQAGAIGLETSKYYSLLSDAIKSQGLNANQAVSQMAMFGATAQDTGLNVTSVADTLNSAAESMAKFGVTAAIGRPIIEGFAKSLTQTGLGIKNANSLTSSLVGSFKQLAESYSLAFVTMQKGGLDFGGGGGALGAGIGLRAKLLEAEKSPEKQADIGKELAKGMRDTIASFTGGEIVTVSEAARSPELQTQYYAQTQLLESMYGIRGADADRTLELMKNLNSVLNSGNDNLSATMEKQLSDFVDMQNKTKDVGEILDIKFSAFLRQQQEFYQEQQETTRQSSFEMLKIYDDATKGGKLDVQNLKDAFERANEQRKAAGLTDETLEAAGKKAADLGTDLWQGAQAGFQTASTAIQGAATAIVNATTLITNFVNAVNSLPSWMTQGQSGTLTSPNRP